jgi:hypothetical protein
MIRDLMKQFGRKHRVYLKIKKVENNKKKKKEETWTTLMCCHEMCT